MSFTSTAVFYDPETPGIEHKPCTALTSVVITGTPGSGPFQDADVSRTPSPRGQESERESHGGDSEARLAKMSTGGLISLSTLLLSGLLLEQHYLLARPCLPGNYTAKPSTADGRDTECAASAEPAQNVNQHKITQGTRQPHHHWSSIAKSFP